MYIRCPDCKASTWAAEADGRVADSVTCKRCGAAYDLRGAEEIGATTEDRHAAAVQFADRTGVDLASAYSMMLGLMPEVAEPTSTAPNDSTESAPADDTVSGVPAYDPGFRKAVAEGLLTPEAARELGDRDSAAARLARRHGLPSALALQVIEHRISLSDALRQAPPKPTDVVIVPANGRQKLMAAGIGGLIAVALGVYAVTGWTDLEDKARAAEARTAESRGTRSEATAIDTKASLSEPASPNTDSASAVDLHTDDEGRLLKVIARNPRAVLDAFCAAGNDPGRYRAEAVVPAAHGAHLGVVRDFDNLETTLAILIRRDRDTGRWSAGTGLEPIVAVAREPRKLP